MKAAEIVVLLLSVAVSTPSFSCNYNNNCNRADGSEETKPRGAAAKKSKQADKARPLTAGKNNSGTTAVAAERIQK